jgi:hypothetical protein
MAGVYGTINSRKDFHRVLREATDITRQLLGVSPSDAVVGRIGRELEAMKNWSESGRQPTESERHSIHVGLIGVREFDGATGQVADLAGKLSELNNYFEDWPSDHQAATATDDDFWNAD